MDRDDEHAAFPMQALAPSRAPLERRLPTPLLHARADITDTVSD